MILQTQMAMSGPARQTISSLTPVIVNGLSIDFTPLSANSKILVKAVLFTSATYVSNWSIYKNGAPTVSTAGFTNNSSSDGTANVTTYIGVAQTVTDQLWPIPIMWSEDSGSLLQRTYDVRAQTEWLGVAETLYINNQSTNNMATFSFMKIMEFVDAEG